MSYSSIPLRKNVLLSPCHSTCDSSEDRRSCRATLFATFSVLAHSASFPFFPSDSVRPILVVYVCKAQTWVTLGSSEAVKSAYSQDSWVSINCFQKIDFYHSNRKIPQNGKFLFNNVMRDFIVTHTALPVRLSRGQLCICLAQLHVDTRQLQLYPYIFWIKECGQGPSQLSHCTAD